MRIKFTGYIDWPEPVDDRGTIDHNLGQAIIEAFETENRVEYFHETGKFVLDGKEIEPFDEGTLGMELLDMTWEVDVSSPSTPSKLG